MIHYLPSLIYRALLGVLLLTALGGCRIFHPYRLPTPKPSLEFKAQQKAAKARKSREPTPIFTKRKSAAPTEGAATDVSTPSGGPVTAPAAPAEPRVIPDSRKVKYDKHGLMKKPRLMRRRVHKHSQPFRPWQSIRNFFKFGLHAKPNYSPDHRPVVPTPTPAPDAVPDAAPEGKP